MTGATVKAAPAQAAIPRAAATPSSWRPTNDVTRIERNAADVVAAPARMLAPVDESVLSMARRGSVEAECSPPEAVGEVDQVVDAQADDDRRDKESEEVEPSVGEGDQPVRPGHARAERRAEGGDQPRAVPEEETEEEKYEGEGGEGGEGQAAPG